MLSTVCEVDVRNLTPEQTYELYKFHGNQRTALCEKYNVEFFMKTQKDRVQAYHLRHGIEKHLLLTGGYHGYEHQSAIHDETIMAYSQDLINFLQKRLELAAFEKKQFNIISSL